MVSQSEERVAQARERAQWAVEKMKRRVMVVMVNIFDRGEMDGTLVRLRVMSGNEN